MLKRLVPVLLGLGLFPGVLGAQEVVHYYHLDAIGNIRALTDQSGNVVERHDYLPFGEECTTGPCAANPAAGAGQPKKLTGKERDVETGLDYFGARYYGSKIGRFTTTDPVYTWKENLVDPQRWNRYAYAKNNPLRYVDPDGRETVPYESLEWAQADYQAGAALLTGIGKALANLFLAANSPGHMTPEFESQYYYKADGFGERLGMEATDVALLAMAARAGGRTPTPEAANTARVGRWMSQAEHDAMLASGRMQESTLSGVSSLSVPPNPAAWSRQTAGTRYVEFDVPSSSIRGSGANSKVYGPNSIFGPKLGIKEMPPATNIKQTATK